MVTRRRPFEWYTANQFFTNLAANAQGNLLIYNAIQHGVRGIKGATVTRLLVDIELQPDSVGQNVVMFWGITMVNADARAALAFPEADDPADRADWLGKGRLQTSSSDLFDGSQWHRVHRDLRAQRVFHSEEDELHLIVDSGTVNVLTWSAFIRVLIRLP